MTWDCSVALSESGQVQPFIWFWQAAQFIIKATAEARYAAGWAQIVEPPKPTLVSFIQLVFRAKSCPKRMVYGKTQTAAVSDRQAPVMLRNLKSGIIRRTLEPKNHILQADLFVLDEVVNVSQRVGLTTCLFSVGFMRRLCPNKSAAC